ncbi:SDR family oxidoreductase [Streptomyces sp. NPDC055078]
MTAKTFAGRIALVTGGGRGIGRHITLALARRGAHVIVNYFHSSDEARRTLEALQAEGGTGELVRASVGSRAGVASLFSAVTAGHDRLDLLVNNAVYGVLGSLGELDDEDWRRTLDVNLHGVRWCVEAALPLMAGGSGAVVNLSAFSVRSVLDRYGAVAASKGAQETLARYLAAELGPRGIRVNTLIGGYVESEAVDYWPDGAERRRRAVAGSALGMMPEPEDIAEAVVFLGSDAARAITGTTLTVDAGASLWQAGAPPLTAAAPGITTTAAVTGSPSAARAEQLVTEPAAGAPPESPGAADPVPGPAPVEDASGQTVAVVGMGLAVPGASSPGEFWELLHQERNVIAEPVLFSLENWYAADPKAEDKSYVKAAGFLWGFTPHPGLAAEQARGTTGRLDLTALLLRHSVLQALDGVTRGKGDRMGAYVGVPPGSLALEDATLRAFARDAVGASGTAREQLADRYPYAPEAPRTAFADRMVQEACAGLLPGDSEFQAVDAACSSSMYAIDLAAKSLLAGERDVVVCGGANTGARRDLSLFSKARGLSRSGQVRAFDAGADGTLFSDAAAVVTLKRLGRARADGDRILGVLGPFGASVDGSGSLVAPDPEGQQLSVRRARTAGGITPEQVEWIVGHGTGTRAGDISELKGLAELAGTARQLITSNKPVVGHGGWASGAISLIHVLLALNHESIPGERFFTRLPDGVRAGNLTVPTTDTPWPAVGGRTRTAGICAYGLGGTNAHLIVYGPERPPTAPSVPGPPAPGPAEPMVLVGWQAQLPGEPGGDEVRAWLTSRGEAPARSFGDTYPLPPFQRLRMPPVSARSIDRTHLMAIAAVAAFAEREGELWASHRDRTGVFVGHAGPTRSMTEYTVRVAADDLADAVRGMPGAPDALRVRLDALRDRLPAANEACMPGQLANVAASQVANRHRLHGMALAVDSGRASTHAALHTAGRYLATGELDVALVIGAAGHSGTLAETLIGSPAGTLAEGAVLLVVTRESLAEREGWPALAGIRTAATPSGRRGDTVWPERDYQGAEGALAVLRALSSGRPSVTVDGADPGPRITVTPLVPALSRTGGDPAAASSGDTATTTTLTVVGTSPSTTATASRTGTTTTATASRTGTSPSTTASASRTGTMPTASTSRTGTTAAASNTGTGTGTGSGDDAVTSASGTVAPPRPSPLSDRSAVICRRADAVPRDPGVPASPAIPHGALILTDSPAVAQALAGPARQRGARLLVTNPAMPAMPADDGVQVVRPGEEFRALTRREPPRDLLLVTSVRGAGAAWPAPPPEPLLNLQECALLAAKDLPSEPGSVAGLVLDPLRRHTTHPHATLITGFLRSLALELPCPVLAVVSDAALDAGLGQLAAERASVRDRTVVHYRQGLRYVERICPVPLPAGRAALPLAVPLGDDAVIVAGGGARGATAATVTALARRLRHPRIWLLGSAPRGAVPEELLAAPDEALPAARRAFLKEQREAAPDASLPELLTRFDTLLRDREITVNLRRLRELCGPGRVHYLACDLRDRDQVRDAARQVYGADGRVDLLIHGAGRIRSRAARDKSLADFRAVRDTKVAGYHHLKEAFADPAPSLWCNFSSGSGLTGCAGDSDYSPANEYLSAAARHRPGSATEEFSLAWGLWLETGMVKDIAGRLSRRLGITGLRNTDGEQVLLAELAHPRPAEPAPFYGLRHGWRAEGMPDFTTPPAPPGGLLGAPDTLDTSGGRWTWRAEKARDTYLADHVVGGRPLMPAVMMAALAAEAARHLNPGADITGFSDLSIEEPLYTDPKGAALGCRVLAKAVEPDRIRVEVRSDLTTVHGRVLVPDRLHCRLDVTLGTRPAAPREEMPPPLPALEDCPTARPDSSVQLSGVWRTALRTGAGPEGGDALWCPRIEPDGIFARLTIPALLIDSLGRLFGYPPQPDGTHIMGVPVSISRIDLYTARTDTELAHAHPEGLRLWYRTAEDRAVAATGEGDVQLAISGLTFHITDTFPRAIRYPEWRP